MWRRVALSFMTGLTGFTFAQQAIESDILLNEQAIGQNTFVQQNNGTFRSRSTLKFGPTEIDQLIEGKLEAGKLKEATVTTKQGPTILQRLTGTNFAVVMPDGKETKGSIPRLPDLLYANFHPQLLTTYFANEPESAAQKGKGSLFTFDSFTFAEVTSTPLSITKFELSGRTQNLPTTELNFGAVKVTVVYSKEANAIVGIDVPAQKFRIVQRGFEKIFADPIAKFPELSQSTHEPQVLTKVAIPLRDGTITYADIARPKADGKYPVILSRTPYGRESHLLGSSGSWWARRGYVFISQDVRGRGDSDGEWDPFMFERKDGYDSVQWAASQPWSNGRVGMTGGSYAGAVQWQAAVELPPALKCIIPMVSPPDAFYNLPFDHGAFMLAPNLWWTRIVAEKNADMAKATEPMKGLTKILTLPLNRVDDEFLGRDVPFFNKWIERDSPAKWTGWNYQSDLPKVTIPSLMISGWWDGDLSGTMMNWEILQKAGRQNHWIIMGPWSHAVNTSSTFADQDYGPDAILELDSLFLRWFDTWLKEKDVKLDNVPKAKIFVTGENEWRSMMSYPHRLSQPRTLYLSAPTSATNNSGGGKLVHVQDKTERPSHIFYNPAAITLPDESPVVTESSTKYDFDALAGDKLFFQSEPMDQPRDLCGPIETDLYFRSTAQDCDFYAQLVDVHPNGDKYVINQAGKIRASYLHGMDKRAPLVPGKTYKVTIRQWDVAHQFKPGHRIGLVISCNMFPLFDRNLGYAEPPATATRMTTSFQTIFHDPSRPSQLRFRLLPPYE